MMSLNTSKSIEKYGSEKYGSEAQQEAHLGTRFSGSSPSLKISSIFPIILSTFCFPRTRNTQWKEHSSPAINATPSLAYIIPIRDFIASRCPVKL
ncbi:hypothetical protein AAHA92_10754 [Salvia divinorum]|uniref:Uncharacterized protein n=1 Tax=Salvia divinorum TaxID=28513 RepID=A0ABD1HZ82_SALDI